MLDELRTFARYAWGLREFLHQPLPAAECRRRLEHQIRRREEAFLQILERGIFANARSPYRKLLSHAGAGFGDLAATVRRRGVEGTLEALYDQGVYVTLDEFKGRKPICRPGLELPAVSRDFDNPLLARHYAARTGGSRGAGSRIAVDLDLLVHESAYYHFFLDAFDLWKRPVALWREVPPGAAGMKVALRLAKLRKPVDRWFTQRRLFTELGDLRYSVFTGCTRAASRMWGIPIPAPDHVPPGDAYRVACWLTDVKRSTGLLPLLDTNASSGVRVCMAAKHHGLDISGTFFRFGGEPFTVAKSEVITGVGCRAVSHYSMAEIGTIGVACASPCALDEVHLLIDKVGVVQRQKRLGHDGFSAGALLYTTLLPSCPKLMLNVESGDYGVLQERSCDCPFGELGFSRHLHTIRSYEKLSSAGMTFLGTELLSLVDEILPARFGGSPTDYQFVEEEEDGLPRVSIVVSPRVPNVDDQEIIGAVLEALRGWPGGPLMTDVWRDSRTLRVTRREPYRTAAFKILPLHILKKQ